MRRLISSCLLAVVFTSLAGVGALSAQTAQTQAPLREPDVVYVPTPPEVVEAMLKVAKVGPNDVVYDFVLAYDKDRLKDAPQGWAVADYAG